ncbi:MAG TPA: hypothetical protein VFZ53_21050 [Polyangiaceae bacterium]
MRYRLVVVATAFVAFATSCGGDVVELGNSAPEPDAGESGGGVPATGGAATVGGGAGVSGSANPGGRGGAGGSSASGGSAGGSGRLRFENASPVAELNTELGEDNPTLTADMLQIFFTSNRDGDADVWFATREFTSDLFGEPRRLAEASTDDDDTSPAISLDGLTLYVGLNERPDGLGNYDIWALERTTRTGGWSELAHVAELNSAEDDIPRPTAVNGTVMPLGSRRGLEGYRTYLAVRPSPDEPFAEPELASELGVDGQNAVDGFLTEDGRVLFFSSAASEGAGDLYYATRPSSTEPFGDPVAITDLNEVSDERDPWLSPDGRWLYFATDREGTLDIFVSAVSRE